jgi:hypothetical protein
LGCCGTLPLERVAFGVVIATEPGRIVVIKVEGYETVFSITDMALEPVGI